MLYLVIGLILIVCVLLVIIVLAQNSKGGGLSSAFGGSGAASMIGVQRTNDLLENLTWGFALALVVLCISTGFIMEEPVQDNVYESPNINAAQNSFTPPAQQQITPQQADTTNMVSEDTAMMPTEVENAGSDEVMEEEVE